MFNKRGRGPLQWPSLIDTGSQRLLACRMEAPLPLDQMERLLASKHFTNGSDRTLVLKLYAETGRACIEEA